MVKPGALRISAKGRGAGAGGGSSSGAEQDPTGVAPRKMTLRRRPALGDISAAVSNNASAPSNPGARQTRKRKASGSFPSASQDPPQRSTGQRRAGPSSSSGATCSALPGVEEDREEDKEGNIANTRRRLSASVRPRRASRGSTAAAAVAAGAASSASASHSSSSSSSSSAKKVAGVSRGRQSTKTAGAEAAAAAAAAAAEAAAAAAESLLAEAAAREERLRRCNVPPSPVSEHDLDDRDEPVACAEYVVDMYKRFKELEEKYTPTVYMHTQMDINCKMRAILIDWIVEVHLKFKLADPTLYLTCHIIDRFCMQENVHRSKLQLVGVTALLIACKYEEIFPTEVRDCVYITDHAYTRDEVLEMEQTILRRLKFELTVPTPWTFLVRFLKVAKATDRQHHRAQYYLERCLQEHDGLSFRPSMLAAASLFLARIPESGLDNAWPDSLSKFCNIPQEGLECCARMIIKFLSDEPVTASQRHLVAVKKKFLGERFLAVAIDDLPELPAKPHIASN